MEKGADSTDADVVELVALLLDLKQRDAQAFRAAILLLGRMVEKKASDVT